jgi:membrane associated rhomboid family serine protease
MFFFPYSCDARLFHLPYVTGALIIFNVLTFSSAVAGRLDPTDGWVLQYGAGIHPEQWLLSRFMHLNFGHILGNMFFLWAFGLVVEGKLGWWKYLACYMGLAVGQAAIEQVIMSGSFGAEHGEGSLGASAAIFGIMVMACIWAPVNQLSVVLLVGWFFFSVEIAVGYFAAIFVGLDLLLSLLLGLGAGSSILHLMGGVMGAAIGYVMLRKRVVDCEDWDLLSVLSGTYGTDKKRQREAAELSAERVGEHLDAKALEARRKFDAYLQINQPEQALAVKRGAQHMGRPLDLDRKDLLQLITGLHKQQKWAESAPIMAELLEVFPAESQAVRLKLAQICLVELERPGRALELVAGLDGAVLPPQQEAVRRKIIATARRKLDDGDLEVDDGAW